jgi:hypothetical protein
MRSSLTRANSFEKARIRSLPQLSPSNSDETFVLGEHSPRNDRRQSKENAKGTVSEIFSFVLFGEDFGLRASWME